MFVILSLAYDGLLKWLKESDSRENNSSWPNLSETKEFCKLAQSPQHKRIVASDFSFFLEFMGFNPQS